MRDFDEIVDNATFDRGSAGPSLQTWLKHLGFLLLTFFTVTIAGILYPFGRIETLPNDDPQTWNEIFQFVISIPGRYVALIFEAIHQLSTNAADLKYSLSFSVSLLFILICHEMGHYVTCRLHRVDATLPFFVPTPPMIGPAGTFGAFIKITSALPSRKAIFDIGVSGPIAGFIAIIPVSIIALLTMHQTPTPVHLPPGSLVFAEPLFFRILAPIFNINLDQAVPNAFYYAAWVGLLVTALNLIPAGQLDGGHVMYAVFGEKRHRWTGRIAFVTMAVLSVLGWIYFNSPSGFLIAILLGFVLKAGHPRPYDQRSIGGTRNLVAAFSLLMFILCFSPFPIRII